MPSLPELSYHELVNLLICFGNGLEGEGSPELKVITPDGRSYPIHCHPSIGCWPQMLGPVLRELGVSRQQFWAWNDHGRKRRLHAPKRSKSGGTPS